MSDWAKQYILLLQQRERLGVAQSKVDAIESRLDRVWCRLRGSDLPWIIQEIERLRL